MPKSSERAGPGQWRTPAGRVAPDPATLESARHVDDRYWRIVTGSSVLWMRLTRFDQRFLKALRIAVD